MDKFNWNWDAIKAKFKESKRFQIIVYIVGGSLALVIGILGYRQLMWMPADEKANDGWWSALNYIEKDSTDQAIKLLVPFVNKYDGHTGGEIGQFLLGSQYMKKGEFRKALNELESVSLNDTYVSVMSVGLQGDCQSELKKYELAMEKYEDAAEMDENDFTTPMFLFKAGLNAEAAGKIEEAVGFYTKIQDEYADFGNQKTIEKYIARVSSVKSK